MSLQWCFGAGFATSSISNDVVSISFAKTVEGKRKPLSAHRMSRVGKALEQYTLFGRGKYSYGREGQCMDTDATVHTALQ